MTSLLSGSLLAANWMCLKQEVLSIQDAGIDRLHIDIMDGHFVPNLAGGPFILNALKSITSLPLDCHLMVSRPEDWIIPCAQAGATSITFHAESTPHLHRTLTQIKNASCQAGIALNPGSPITLIQEVLSLVDFILIMSVNPGFSGQTFIPTTFQKVQKLSTLQQHPSFSIMVDGGLQKEHLNPLQQAGAHLFVLGSSLLGQIDRKKTISEFKEELIS